MNIGETVPCFETIDNKQAQGRCLVGALLQLTRTGCQCLDGICFCEDNHAHRHLVQSQRQESIFVFAHKDVETFGKMVLLP